MQGKLIIFSAPSGSGKTTIVKEILKEGLNASFSVSATTRAPRSNEVDGVDYHFLSPQVFKERIALGDFIEYEEVYDDLFYGTLKQETNLTLQAGKNIILDVDVVGGVNVKKLYGEQACTLFIKPPSIEVLRQRLEGRGTDSADIIAHRIAKAEKELSFAEKFDHVIVNDQLDEAIKQVRETIHNFLKDS